MVKTWLERASNLSIGASSDVIGSSVLVECIFFLVLFMCTFSVDMYGKRCFMSSNVRFVYV